MRFQPLFVILLLYGELPQCVRATMCPSFITAANAWWASLGENADLDSNGRLHNSRSPSRAISGQFEHARLQSNYKPPRSSIVEVPLVSRARPSHTAAFIQKELNAAVCEGLARETRSSSSSDAHKTSYMSVLNRRP